MAIIEINVETGEQTEREYTAEELAAIAANQPKPIEITVVTMRQARLALLQEGLLDDVEALITTPEQRIWWDYSATVEKYNPLCQEIATALNLDLTKLFELAATL